jgi:hypothetical protein
LTGSFSWAGGVKKPCALMAASVMRRDRTEV